MRVTMEPGAYHSRYGGYGVAIFLIFISCQCFFVNSAATKRPASAVFTDSSQAKIPAGKRVVMNSAFKNAGQKAGLEIWRIQNFEPVPYPQSDYGKFYSGDSYIVLYTQIKKSGEKLWDIHFWLGLETSQDEAGAAAINAVHLDDQLGGTPVQYREVQEHESQLFLSRFKNGVRYLPGGVQSGFKHVDPNAFEKRLFHVKGQRNIRVKQVDLSIASMNKGDCFILDVGRNIYVYVGVKSKRMEKLKAIAAANQIRDQDHAGKSRVTIVDEFSPPKEIDEFFSALGFGSANEIADETAGGDDKQFETNEERSVTLFKISDASGKLKTEAVAQRPFKQQDLNTNDCFILDTAGANIFVWVGKKCTKAERDGSMKKAEEFLKTKKYPSWTHIQKIIEGAETTAFTQYFPSWKGARELHARIVREASNDEEWESRLFHVQIKTGTKVEIEQIIDYDQEDLAQDDIMLLDLGTNLYVWIGKDASPMEKLKAQEIAEEYLAKNNRENVPITKVLQGEEEYKFKSQFDNWNDKLWDQENDKYYKVKEFLQIENNKLAF